MTDTDINESIAEAVGVQFVEHDDGLWSVRGPGASLNRGGLDREHAARVALKYTWCLNAMHEAIAHHKTKIACDAEMFIEAFCENLAIVMGYCLGNVLTFRDGGHIANATARQRAEAFLRTIGKWRSA